ncbi:response regulator [Coraliomargarita akajimensis]|uniref:histidine kinase n=1 Tax=Coraliomargarita akajimensis (strain DSM 45221 / IAM 15411 / JCM 23193 / KCTC 12865 / 04OKA010-24) TaxID=583355 RepID=D5ENM0_CORAD|nr:response regulator [Coraliomargarita akajimensis]ADE55496.1 histidine kinase [Coraliomargarita akajimensis DSM 45221]
MDLLFPILAVILFVVVCALTLALVRQKRELKHAVVSAKEEPTVDLVSAGESTFTSNALFATLSHELRTPLNGVLGLSQMLNDNEDREELVAIEGCARHMLAVLHTLVNLSKIQVEWDDLPEYREWVSVYELAEQVKKNVEFRANLRGLTIQLGHQDKTTRLRGDWDHLRTIMENVMLGSIEGVSLDRVPDERQPMTVTWKLTEKGAIEIDIENPLETFYIDHAMRTRLAYESTTGANHSRIQMQFLYCSVATALLEKHDGVMLTTEVDGGGVKTRVNFEMESMEASETKELPVGGLSLSNQGAPEAKQSLKIPVELSILVAEDDPIARSLMEAVLKHMGQSVTFAINGREVLEQISSDKHFDVILMDIDMPLMDGVSAAIALRNAEAGDTGLVIPIVAVTAFNTLSDQGKFKRAGMNYFLPKPVKLLDLRRVLVDVIRKENLAQEVS